MGADGEQHEPTNGGKDRPKAVLFVGPTAEGVSTEILQFTLKMSPRVAGYLEVYDATLFFKVNANLLPKKPHVVIYDAFQSEDRLPGYLFSRQRSDSDTVFVFGVRPMDRYSLEKQLKRARIDFRTVFVPPVKECEADKFVAKIHEHGAHPVDQEIERTKEFFVDGIGTSGKYGGLWPAMFQATRGTSLDQRINQLTASLDHIDRLALALVSFTNFVYEYASIPPAVPSRRLLDRLLENLDIDSDISRRVRSAIGNLPYSLEGEIRNPYGPENLRNQSNPEYFLRHPALTEATFRWLFGAKDPAKGNFQYSKWNFFDAYLRAVLQNTRAIQPKHVYSIFNVLVQTYFYDLKVGGALRTRLDAENLDRQMGDNVLDLLDIVHRFIGADLHVDQFTLRRFELLTVELLTHPQRDVSEADRRRSYSMMKLICSVDLKNAPFSFLSRVAQVSSWMNFEVEEGGNTIDFRKIYDWAEADEKTRTKGKGRSALAKRMISEIRRNDLPDDEFISLINRSRMLEDGDYWEADKYSELRSLLKIVKSRRLVELGKIERSASSEGSFSLRQVYFAFWRDIFRKIKHDPAFKYIEAFGVANKFTFTEGVVGSMLKDWVGDFASHQEELPGDLYLRLQDACYTPSKWVSFFLSYEAK